MNFYIGNPEQSLPGNTNPQVVAYLLKVITNHLNLQVLLSKGCWATKRSLLDGSIRACTRDVVYNRQNAKGLLAGKSALFSALMLHLT